MQLKKSSIIIGLIALIAIITIGWFFLRPQGKLTFNLAPNEMTLKVNNKQQVIRHNQTQSFEPGTYTFEFSRDGFASETKSITIENAKTTQYTMALSPRTDAARKIIADNPEYKKIIEAYRIQQEAELASLLPITTTEFLIKSCRSAKQPQSDKPAFCITTKDAKGTRLARLYLKQLGFNPDELEVMAGQKNLMTVLSTDTYKVEMYSTDTEDKPTLYITPLNVPYVPISTPYNEQLESIRTTSLSDLEAKGYDLDNYVIVFSNIYLTRYNADHVHSDGGEDGHGH